MWGIAAASFVAIFAFAVPFPAIVVGRRARGLARSEALAGRVRARRWPWRRRGRLWSGAHRRRHTHAAACVFSRARLVRVRGGLVLWAVALAVVAAVFGTSSTLTVMGWFFSKAALVTFGGAYAVLPYVYQGAVETHQWLSGRR